VTEVCRRYRDPDTLRDALFDQIYAAEAAYFGKPPPARRVALQETPT
jgi:hypothetical protein